MPDPLLTKRTTLLVAEQVATTGAADARGNGRKTLEPATPPAPVANAGGIGSTTFVSAQLSAAANSDYVGNWLEARDGPNLGQLVRITGFVAATDTATHEAWPSSTLPTSVRMWLPADPVVPATSTSGDGATVVSTVRTEGANYWARSSAPAGTASNSKRYMLVGLGGVNVGRASEITGWANGTNTFTVSPAFASTPTLGDLYVIRKFMRGDVEFAPGQAYFERATARASFDEIEGVAGPREASVAFTTEVKGSGVAAGNSTDVTIPPLESGTLLDAMMAAQQDNSGTLTATAVGAGDSTTTRLNIVEATRTRFTVGNFVLVAGEAAVVTARTDGGANDDTLTIEPALSQAPTGQAGPAITVFGSTTYRPAETGHLCHHAEAWLGDRGRHEAWGGMSDIVLDLVPNALPKWSWSFAMADHRHRYESAGLLYSPIEDTRLPFDAKALRCVLDNVTMDLVRSAKLAMGYAIEMRTALGNGRAGEAGAVVVGRKSIIELELEYEDVARSDGYLRQFAAHTIVNCLVQHGTVAGDVTVFYAPRAVVMETPKIGTDGGRYTLSLKLKPIQPTATAVTTATTLATVAIGAM